ncbi:uncharacterized protein [Onthophagus taurus]|uniref:uncharacterized protein n=1 Tax=Onthophagus taurus TaxID=166361 RepID=UPI0039BE2577
MTSTRRNKSETNSFELVLNENESLIGEKDDLQVDLQNIICGGNTVLLDGNQYYIHSNEVEAVILNPDEGNNAIQDVYIKDNEEEPIQFVQEEIESNSNLIYSVGGKRLKLENGKIFNLEGIQQFTDELGILNQFRSICCNKRWATSFATF